MAQSLDRQTTGPTNHQGESRNPDRSETPAMFDRIAPRYDLLNRLLSGGNDIFWRNRLARNLPDGNNLDVLDLATGTADILLAMGRTGRVGLGLGLDMAGEMLRLGQSKIDRRSAGSRMQLVQADATAIPCGDGSFDAVTIAFGIRNVIDVNACLSEMHRVLRPGGIALVLEFSLPDNTMLRRLHLFYLRHFLPRIGALVSGDGEAYRYLDETIEAFPYGEAFCTLMRQSGFGKVEATPLSLGVATLYRGYRKA